MDIKDAKAVVSQRIKQAREYKGKSINEISMELGIDSDLWKAYEDGLYLPDVNLIIKLSSHLDISINFISGFSDDITVPSSVNQNPADPETIKTDALYYFSCLLEAFLLLDNENKKDLANKLKELNEKALLDE